MADGGIVFHFELDGRRVLTAYGSDPGGLRGDDRVWVETVHGWMGEPGKPRVDGRAARLAGGSIPLSRVGLDGRTITISGWAEPDPGTGVDEWALLLPGRIWPADTRQHRLVLRSEGHGVDVWARVELDGQITATPSHASGLVDWSIPLHAVSPVLQGSRSAQAQESATPLGVGLVWPLFKHGVIDWGEAALPAPQPLANRGSLEAWPVVTVSGNALSGVRIGDGAGRWAYYRGACLDAAPVTLDFATGRASVRGQTVTVPVTGRLWSVPARGTVTPVVVPLQSGTTAVADFTLTARYL